MLQLLLLLLLASFSSCTVCAALSWDTATEVLKVAVEQHVFPGCVALVADRSGVIYLKAVGDFTYGIPPPFNHEYVPPMTEDTLFDLASLTKVVAGLSAVAQFYQQGDLNLDSYVVSILPEFFSKGKDKITVRNLLLHNAGFPPDPSPSYYDSTRGCPESSIYYPLEKFSCRSLCFLWLMEQSLQYPVGSEFVYSDLSFITIMNVVGKLAKVLGYVDESDLLSSCPPSSLGWEQCYFEAYVRKHVFQPFGINDTGFLPPESLWSSCAPTENDTYFRHHVMQGQVHDPNSYAMGGISGHAGLFSTVKDLERYMKRWLFATETDSLLNATTVAYFVREYNHSQSSRALGWDTNDHTVDDEGYYACGSLSPTTFTHTGFTGTLVCADPERNLISILLTNRVYPDTSNTHGIHAIRRAFNNVVQRVYDQSIQHNNLKSV